MDSPSVNPWLEALDQVYKIPEGAKTRAELQEMFKCSPRTFYERMRKLKATCVNVRGRCYWSLPKSPPRSGSKRAG